MFWGWNSLEHVAICDVVFAIFIGAVAGARRVCGSNWFKVWLLQADLSITGNAFVLKPINLGGARSTCGLFSDSRKTHERNLKPHQKVLSACWGNGESKAYHRIASAKSNGTRLFVKSRVGWLLLGSWRQGFLHLCRMAFLTVLEESGVGQKHSEKQIASPPPFEGRCSIWLDLENFYWYGMIEHT